MSLQGRVKEVGYSEENGIPCNSVAVIKILQYIINMLHVLCSVQVEVTSMFLSTNKMLMTLRNPA